MHRVTRLAYNTSGWTRPTSEARESEGSDTYNGQYGFGHEDWLFRNEWVIDGWRYAFIQGFNKSNRLLVAAGEPVDVTLFTVRPDKTRLLVGTIQQAEALNDTQAHEAVEAFRDRGWIDLMRSEIARAGGDASALEMSKQAKHVLNVRFRIENCQLYSPPQTIPATDGIYAHGRARYSLQYLDKLESQYINTTLSAGRRGTTEPPQSKTHLRSATAAVEVTPEHAKMQAALGRLLQVEYPRARIVFEENFVDVKVETDDQIILFEIKSDLSPRSVLRQAIGQLLEYAFHPAHSHGKPVNMVAVGRNKLDSDERQYLETLASLFNMPLTYRVVAI
jgi:hypothetical protein